MILVLLVFLVAIIFILVDVIIFLLTSKPLTDEEEMEERVLLVSEKMKEIFK